MQSSGSPSRHSVTGSERIGPYTLLRLEREANARDILAIDVDFRGGPQGRAGRAHRERAGNLIPRPKKLMMSPNFPERRPRPA